MSLIKIAIIKILLYCRYTRKRKRQLNFNLFDDNKTKKIIKLTVKIKKI